jgi:hypothetical protein
MLGLLLAAALAVPPNDSDLEGFCQHAERPGRTLVVAVRERDYGECVLRDHVSDVDALLRKSNGTWKVIVSGGGAIGPADYRLWGVPSDIARALAEKRAAAERMVP